MTTGGSWPWQEPLFCDRKRRRSGCRRKGTPTCFQWSGENPAGVEHKSCRGWVADSGATRFCRGAVTSLSGERPRRSAEFFGAESARCWIGDTFRFHKSHAVARFFAVGTTRLRRHIVVRGLSRSAGFMRLEFKPAERRCDASSRVQCLRHSDDPHGQHRSVIRRITVSYPIGWILGLVGAASRLREPRNRDA